MTLMLGLSAYEFASREVIYCIFITRSGVWEDNTFDVKSQLPTFILHMCFTSQLAIYDHSQIHVGLFAG